jgi:hypothetical protein
MELWEQPGGGEEEKKTGHAPVLRGVARARPERLNGHDLLFGSPTTLIDINQL